MTDKFPGCPLAKEWTKEKKANVISQHFFPEDKVKRHALHWQIVRACNMELYKGMGEYGDDDAAEPRGPFKRGTA